MAVFVVDASVALAWCFEDEATDWTDAFRPSPKLAAGSWRVSR